MRNAGDEIKRLAKAAIRANSVDEFIREVASNGSWYLKTDFLKRQAKPFFVDFYNMVKGVRS